MIQTVNNNKLSPNCNNELKNSISSKNIYMYIFSPNNNNQSKDSIFPLADLFADPKKIRLQDYWQIQTAPKLQITPDRRQLQPGIKFHQNLRLFELMNDQWMEIGETEKNWSPKVESLGGKKATVGAVEAEFVHFWSFTFLAMYGLLEIIGNF